MSPPPPPRASSHQRGRGRRRNSGGGVTSKSPSRRYNHGGGANHRTHHGSGRGGGSGGNNNDNNATRRQTSEGDFRNRNKQPQNSNIRGRSSSMDLSGCTDVKRARYQSSNLPSSLDVVSFSVVRSSELRVLKQQLRAKTRVKRVYQQLCWHSRRRSMSHSAKRMPRRLYTAHKLELQQGGALKENNGTGRKRLRKYRGRARFLVALKRVQRLRKGFMNTHVWHAKRFRMRGLFSTESIVVDNDNEMKVNDQVIVPSRCNDRGVRSMCKTVCKKAVLCDYSFLHVFNLCVKDNDNDNDKHNDNDNLDNETFDKIFNASDACKLKVRLRQLVLMKETKSDSDSDSEGQLEIVRNIVVHDSKTKLPVTPVDVLLMSTKRMVLWTRPETSNRLLQTLLIAYSTSGDSVSKVSVSRCQVSPTRFSVLGAGAHDTISKVLTSSLPNAREVKEGTVVRARFDRNRRNIAKNVHMPKERTIEYEFQKRNDGEKDSDSVWDVLCMQRNDGILGWDLVTERDIGLALWMTLAYATRGRAMGVDDARDVEIVRGRGDVFGVFPEEFADCMECVHAILMDDRKREADMKRKPKGKRKELGEGLMQSLWRIVGRHDGNEDDNDEKMMERDLKRMKLNNGNVVVGNQQHAVRIVRGRKQHVRNLVTSDELKGDCDQWLVRAAIMAKGKGVPRRGALIRLKTNKDDDKDEDGDGDGDGDGDMGVVVAGTYGLANGCGIGRALVRVDAVRKALGESTSRRNTAPKQSASTKQKQPTRLIASRGDIKWEGVFRNCEQNSVWRQCTLQLLF